MQVSRPGAVARQPDDDATVEVRRRRARQRRPGVVWFAVAAVAFVLAVGGGAAWLLLGRSALPPTGGDVARSSFPLANEHDVLAARSTDVQVFRFRDAPAVLVLSFPTLAQQGQMLNRIGAFVERSGLPHDRVLTDEELGAAIRQSGDTPDTYYYGHDYRLSDLVRFFALADTGGIAVNQEERRLRRMLEEQNLLRPGVNGALISIPPEVDDVDPTMRAATLRHELSHGMYFTDPAYAGYARAFWIGVMTEKQRADFRAYLATQGYDLSDEDLMLNEAQAYLVHTPDPRLFKPELAGLSRPEGDRLRDVFIRGMPESWLKRASH